MADDKKEGKSLFLSVTTATFNQLLATFLPRKPAKKTATRARASADP